MFAGLLKTLLRLLGRKPAPPRYRMAYQPKSPGKPELYGRTLAEDDSDTHA